MDYQDLYNNHLISRTSTAPMDATSQEAVKITRIRDYQVRLNVDLASIEARQERVRDSLIISVTSLQRTSSDLE